MALGFLATALVFAAFLHATQRTPQEEQIQAIFTASDGPCRSGDRAACMPRVDQLRALGDFPDGSLLLGDCNIARYLGTLPGGVQLEARWRQDRITEAELLDFGNDTYTKNLPVCRSFWMYAQIKRDHVAVPQFVINDGKL